MQKKEEENIRLVKITYSHIILYDIGHYLSYPPNITQLLYQPLHIYKIYNQPRGLMVRVSDY